MTTTKAEGKSAQAPPKQDQIPQEDLQAAYEIHTLAQALYGRLAMANPWVAPSPPLASFEVPTAWNVPPTAPPTWNTPSGWAW